MKEILVVYTGGTICSFTDNEYRSLDVDSAKSVIVNNFENGISEYANIGREILVDSGLGLSTLSENMTIDKLNIIIGHIKSFDLTKYAGVIILHGTDTLAYTASILSFVFQNIQIPVMIVAGNRPPDDEDTNANENFRVAVELILKGISPNVYIPYRNSDKKMWLHLAATVAQSPGYTGNLYNACDDKKFPITNKGYNGIIKKCRAFSKKRLTQLSNSEKEPDALKKQFAEEIVTKLKKIKNSVLVIKPYMGISYKNIDLQGVRAIVHGTFHSGTVCVERNNVKDAYTADSILYFADRCRDRKIPLFIAPSILSREQYSSVYDAVENGGIIPVDMTIEAAQAKLLVGVSLGYKADVLEKFMQTPVNNEFIYS